MKIRSGFVSNSSSSSFVVFATKEQIDEALSKVDKKFKGMIKKTFVTGSKKIKFKDEIYLRNLGTFYSEDLYGEEDFDEEAFMSESLDFFKNIGPVSSFDEY